MPCGMESDVVRLGGVGCTAWEGRALMARNKSRIFAIRKTVRFGILHGTVQTAEQNVHNNL